MWHPGYDVGYCHGRWVLTRSSPRFPHRAVELIEAVFVASGVMLSSRKGVVSLVTSGRCQAMTMSTPALCSISTW